MTSASTDMARNAMSGQARRTSRGPFLDDWQDVSAATWWESAACRSLDADLFCVPDGVSPRRRREQERKAKRICRICPVRGHCLEEALRRDEQYGVWGGLDAEERKELKLERSGHDPRDEEAS